ncbi:MAG TPA: beta-ketoacyl-[acyl-carrier-protein] synthase family protein [Aggregatilineales bacterium]|nr:beta-ketoacyl-[acyl-carrier-protein] synthase family protein [Aggregatilineales bacterium]
MMDLERNGRTRVVVTGLGAIAPRSGNFHELWDNLKNGRSGIRRITRFDPKAIGVKVAGEVDYDLKPHLDPKEGRRMARASQLAQVATQQAMQDAGLTGADLEPIAERVGIIAGTTLGGLEVNMHEVLPFPAIRVRPTSLMNSLPNMPAYYMASLTNAEGPSSTLSTACASGAQVVGEGAEWIQYGRADIVFAAGVEGLIEENLVAGLEAMAVMAPGFEDDPTRASRPFDANRKGLVLSEGTAVVVLESLERARKRGARIYAEVLGYGFSTDNSSPAIPRPDGKPARLAMEMALKDAHLSPEVIEYINPHGPGTKGDAVETLAIKHVFGERAYNIPVSSTKSMMGHSMGASGALEAVASILTIFDGVIHPTINYETPDPECDLDYVPNVAREAKVRYAMSNNYGLGGQNATLVFGAF